MVPVGPQNGPPLVPWPRQARGRCILYERTIWRTLATSRAADQELRVKHPPGPCRTRTHCTEPSPPLCWLRTPFSLNGFVRLPAPRGWFKVVEAGDADPAVAALDARAPTQFLTAALGLLGSTNRSWPARHGMACLRSVLVFSCLFRWCPTPAEKPPLPAGRCDAQRAISKVHERPSGA